MKELSEKMDRFGMPLVEMSNLRSVDTGLPFSLHVRSKEETEKTFHPEIPTLKVYENRPGKSNYFSVTISETPSVVEKHKEFEFYKSVDSVSLMRISQWIVLNRKSLLDFWENGGTWFEDEKKAWIASLKKMQ
jgi:hypothetical protein